MCLFFGLRTVFELRLHLLGWSPTFQDGEYPISATTNLCPDSAVKKGFLVDACKIFLRM